MKNLKKAFTFIELIVVISIITLISSTGIFYFLDFVQEQEISQKLYIIEDDIKQLDKKIKNYEILDYELVFNTSNETKKSYITYINNFDSNNQKLTINDITGSGVIESINSGTGILRIYKKNKLYVQKIIDKNIDYNYNFDDSENYKITGSFSGETINDIVLNYFSEDNLYPEKNDLIELININTEEDKTGTAYDNIKITNIGGNKNFYNNSTEIIINEIYLFFENNGKEKFIKISK